MQCIAQLIAAQKYNQEEGRELKALYGCVTTGEIWQFLYLSGKTTYMDKTGII